MHKTNKCILCIVVLIFLFICTVAVGKKLISHERNQSKQISELMGKTEYLQEKLNQTVDYYKIDVKFTDSTYNYFAIGNSLTMITSWGRGICSTKPDNDYFHLVSSELKRMNQGKKVVSYAYNFSTWERAGDRDSRLDLLDVYLDSKLDLVSIQLGENVEDLTTYESDLESLISYVHVKCPKAKIIIVGDFWDESRNKSRKVAAESVGVFFADLEPIIGNKDYQSQTGQICYLSDGQTITVPDVASTHPGDTGMKYIADQIISCLVG